MMFHSKNKTVAYCVVAISLCLIFILMHNSKYVTETSKEVDKNTLQLDTGLTFQSTIPVDSQFFQAFANTIAFDNDFVFIMFLNDAYLDMTKSWICRIEALSPDVLKFTMFITTSDTLSLKLQAWKRGLNTFVQPYPVTTPVAYGTLEYFQMILQRLRVQNMLLQAGTNIHIIESDSTWNSNNIITLMRAKLKHHDIIAADDNGNGFLCPGFMAIRSTEKSRAVYDALVEKYAAKLSTYKVGLTHYIGDDGGEQPMLLNIIKQFRLEVNWLSQCEYANGKWYRGREFIDPKCPTPMVIHNNYIIGNGEKIKRAKLRGHWFLDNNKACF